MTSWLEDPSATLYVHLYEYTVEKAMAPHSSTLAWKLMSSYLYYFEYFYFKKMKEEH